MNKKKLAVTFFLGTWGIGRLAEGCYMSGAAKGLSTIFLWWTPIPFVWWGADVYKIATSGNFCHSKKSAQTLKKEPAQKREPEPQGGGRKKSRRHGGKSNKGTRKRRS